MSKKRESGHVFRWLAAFAVSALVWSAEAEERVLAKYVPDDVFLYVSQQPNAERAFLAAYWAEVMSALNESGVASDALELVALMVGTEEKNLEKVFERARRTIGAVDWEALGSREIVFAERFGPLQQFATDTPPVLVANMVVLLRGEAEAAGAQYERIVQVMHMMSEEVNTAVGNEMLMVERAERYGAKVARMDPLARITNAPSMPILVAVRDDLIVIGFQESLFADVLSLLDGRSRCRPLIQDSRFQQALAQLPPAEDAVTYFDMKRMIEPIRQFVGNVIRLADKPDDIYRNSGMKPEVAQLNARALAAYGRGDYREALATIRTAYEQAPENSILLYNLACFNALNGNREEALAWLEKAVAGGFYAPRKIAMDSDLESLRDDPRYQAALERASAMAAAQRVKDVVENSSKSGEAYGLLMQAWRLHEEKDYEQALRLTEQAQLASPDDSRVLYGLACFHTLLGHEERGLEFLERAVEAGFYSPHHIANDPDLAALHGTERFKVAVVTARRAAVRASGQQKNHELRFVQHVIDRVADAAGTIDYSVTVESTEGYTTRMDSVVVLAPDAREKPLYPILAAQKQVDRFDRFLPKETESFIVSGGTDLRKVHDFITETLSDGGRIGEDLLGRFEQLQAQFGFDLHRDLLNWLGSESINITLENGQWIWMLEVREPEVARAKVGGVVDLLASRLPELIRSTPELGMLAMLSITTDSVERKGLEGFQEIRLSMSPEPIVWGVRDGYLMFGASADALELCLETAAGRHPGIRENERLMRELVLPDGPCISISLTDYRGLGTELAEGAGIAAMVTGMMSGFTPEPEARPVLLKLGEIFSKLAPVARRIDFFKSTATCVTFDGQRWHSTMSIHYREPEQPVDSSARSPR